MAAALTSAGGFGLIAQPFLLTAMLAAGVLRSAIRAHTRAER